MSETMSLENWLNELLTSSNRDFMESMTTKEREAYEHAEEVRGNVSDLMNEAVSKYKEDGLGKLSYNKGVTGKMYGEWEGFVTKIRGRARLGELGDIIEKLNSEIVHSTNGVTDRLELITNCPRGSITKTFKDEDFVEEVARVVTAMTYTAIALDALAAKIEEKIETANQG